MTVLCYGSISQTVNILGVWKHMTWPIYRQVDWIAESSSMCSSIAGLTTWWNQNRAALHSGIPLKPLRFYSSRIAVMSSNRKANRNTAIWKLKYWTDFQNYLAGIDCRRVTNSVEWVWKEVEPRLDSSAAQLAWQYIGKVIWFKHQKYR